MKHFAIVFASRSVEAQHKGARFSVRVGVHPRYKITGENEQNPKGKVCQEGRMDIHSTFTLRCHWQKDELISTGTLACACGVQEARSTDLS
jgi:hypothetical protein